MLLYALIGCSPGALDADEAVQVFDALGAVPGGGRYQVFVTGTVGGHDVNSGWDATDAFGF